MDEFFEDDELTEADLKFLEQWEKLGKSETSDGEYTPDVEGGAQGEGGTTGESVSIDSDAGGEPGESDFVDESKMDLSDMGSKSESDNSQPRATDDNPESDSNDQGDEDDYDESDWEDVDYDDTEFLDLEPDEADDEISEDSEGDELETDDGEGERGNSDEARESDEPISHSKEIENDAESESGEKPEADAESESDSMDAQQELEAHLEENQQKPEENLEIPEGAFDHIPDPGEICTNHCEDNPVGDHDGECPHCVARIKAERELWGPIARDMHDKDILPGDRLRVSLPISFMIQGAILAANVPNQVVDPIRVAESTGGKVDPMLCWLSGSISQFTGWHMKESGNPIWTFERGKKIGFVEKIGVPHEHGEHGSNAEEGDQLDIEDIIEDLLEEHSNQEPEEENGEPPIEEESEPEPSERDRKIAHARKIAEKILMRTSAYSEYSKELAQAFLEIFPGIESDTDG